MANSNLREAIDRVSKQQWINLANSLAKEHRKLGLFCQEDETDGSESEPPDRFDGTYSQKEHPLTKVLTGQADSKVTPAIADNPDANKALEQLQYQKVLDKQHNLQNTHAAKATPRPI